MSQIYVPPQQSIIHGPLHSDSRYAWALEKRDSGVANHWTAPEISMATDIEQWNSGALTPDEQMIVKRNLGFFTTADSLAANNIVLGTLRHVRVKQVRKFLERQAYEEGVHTEAYLYIVQSLALDEEEIFNSYRTVPSIRAKDEFLLPFIEVLADPHYQTGSFEADQKLLKSLFAFACLMEGLFFYVGFVQILAFGRRNRLPGASLQYRYILRDESLHCNFGIDLINAIKAALPHLWTEKFQHELCEMTMHANRLEAAYARDTMPRGMLGLTAASFEEYLRFICNRRTDQCGLPELYPGATNPFPWMAEMLDLRREANFFETRVLDYQQSSELDWD